MPKVLGSIPAADFSVVSLGKTLYPAYLSSTQAVKVSTCEGSGGSMCVKPERRVWQPQMGW